MVRVLDGVLLLDKEENDRIWVMTFNRPERMNAFNGDMRAKVHQTYWDFARDETARVLIITGNGRGFGSGQDLRERAERDEAKAAGLPDPMVVMPDHLQNIFPLAESLDMWIPTIAAINGVATAGGFNHAMQCDVRIACEEHAEVGVGEARWNQGAGWVSHLPRIIGMSHALELVLWADKRVNAQRAYEMGFVNEVTPHDKLMDTAMSWAERMLDLAPRAVRNFKEILYKGSYMGPFEMRRFAGAIEYNLRGMNDSVEGPKAFSEKRKPIFTDT